MADAWFAHWLDSTVGKAYGRGWKLLWMTVLPLNGVE